MLHARNLRVTFTRKSSRLFRPAPPPLVAVDGVNLEIGAGESVGLVGESGCGKSTLSRALMQLVRPQSGEVLLDGVDLCRLGERELRPYRRRVQMVFQDPFSSLNPRLTVGQAVAEPIIVHGLAPAGDVVAKVADLFALVGLSASMLGRYPHELSGGQRQRVGIARALGAHAQLLICDEPVSSLDVSIQAQIVNLFEQLRGRLGLAYLFVSHDLAVVRHLSDRIAVMYLGRIVELAARDDLYRRPVHPYTQLLIESIPTTDRAAEKRRGPTRLRGELPSALNPPAGCAFHPRCPRAMEVCRTTPPALTLRRDGRQVACHLPDETLATVVLAAAKTGAQASRS